MDMREYNEDLFLDIEVKKLFSLLFNENILSSQPLTSSNFMNRTVAVFIAVTRKEEKRE